MFVSKKIQIAIVGFFTFFYSINVCLLLFVLFRPQVRQHVRERQLQTASEDEKTVQNDALQQTRAVLRAGLQPGSAGGRTSREFRFEPEHNAEIRSGVRYNGVTGIIMFFRKLKLFGRRYG